MTPERIEKIKEKISRNIQNFINGISPIFESYHTLEDLKAGENGIDRAYNGGIEAIRNSPYNLTEEERNELFYYFEIEYSAVYDLVNHAKFNIENGIQ